jgi:hypothetical protein
MPRHARQIHVVSLPPECSFEEAALAFTRATDILLRADARLKGQEKQASEEDAGQRENLTDVNGKKIEERP